MKRTQYSGLNLCMIGPVDWASNGSDAFRYMATGHRITEIKRDIRYRAGGPGETYGAKNPLQGHSRGSQIQPYRDPLQRRVS
jgi:hypothetical protein